MNIRELCDAIAHSISQSLAQSFQSGRIGQSDNVLRVFGAVGAGGGGGGGGDGDVAGTSAAAASVDFGSFDISGLGREQEADAPSAEAASDSHASEREESSISATEEQQQQEAQQYQQQHSIVSASASAQSTRLRTRRVLTRYDESDSSEKTKRRKLTGGLRLVPGNGASTPEEYEEPEPVLGRRLQPSSRLPQRKLPGKDEPAMKPSTLSKLIVGIWEQIFSSISFDMSAVAEEWHDQGLITEETSSAGTSPAAANIVPRTANRAFSQMNVLCRKISQASRVSRALEVIVQARWIEHFDDRTQTILRGSGSVTLTRAKMTALAEACRDFGWTEKELRNKMAIWRGYQQIKEEGGWVCLVFAGMGIYRFCKYRVEFTAEAMQTIRRLRSRFEVAADTLHPRWREMLSIVDAASPRLYTGHPHDWVVSDYEEPVPLAQTYLEWDPNFTFTHLDTSVVDVHAWGASDPRLITSQTYKSTYVCHVCAEHQSDDAAENACRCFPNLFGSSNMTPAPVQVFRTRNGKNNGLIACCPIERGTAIGEFLGLVTKGLEGVDVMQAAAEQGRYQIWQGREGNHTKFANHSCRPMAQFERFVWMGTERWILVSKGIEAGTEITVDYSDSYWHNLEKVCLCNEACCRFKDKGRVRSI